MNPPDGDSIKLSDPTRIRELLEQLETNANEFRDSIGTALQLEKDMKGRHEELIQTLATLRQKAETASNKIEECERRAHELKGLEELLKRSAENMEKEAKAALVQLGVEAEEKIDALRDKVTDALIGLGELEENVRTSLSTFKDELQPVRRQMDQVQTSQNQIRSDLSAFQDELKHSLRRQATSIDKVEKIAVVALVLVVLLGTVLLMYLLGRG